MDTTAKAWSGRKVLTWYDRKIGTVLEWEPLSAAGCDVLLELEDGSKLWHDSASLRPADGGGPLPSRREAIEYERAVAKRQLLKIRADLAKEIQEHKPWPGMEFGKAHVGMMIDGALEQLGA